MKHTITFFAVLLLAMAIPANAQNYLFSDTLADGQVLYFDTLNGEARVVRPGTGIALNNYITGNVVVPSTVTYYGMTYVVTTLACVGNYGTFEGCSSLLSVSLPNTITAIDKYAFYNCTGMTNISMPDSVVSIGHNAFSHCTSLVSINIPDAVTSIGDYAFSGCTSITDTLTIPSTVASIGQNAFSNVPMIQYFGKSIDYFPWNAVNAVTFTIDSLIYSDPNHSMLVGYVNGITIADIPDTVLKMKRECFYQCSTLVSVICPNSVTTIPRGAFSSCPNLIFVDIPSSVT